VKEGAVDKVIFVLHRRPELSRQECLREWSGERHAALVARIPGLRRWVQNHVRSAPGEPVCDGIGELWFDSAEAVEKALASDELAAAVEDAARFLDLDRTGLVVVEERPMGDAA
jgi:uncharacterized protein (TIGR02118 family)